MKYLIVKSIFCPNQEFYNITIDSIVKLDFYLNDSIDVLLIGYIGKFEKNFQTFLKIFPTKLNIKTEYFYLNYGKYYLFNKLFNYINNYDYLIYMDHDIIFDCKNPFETIEKVDVEKTGLIVFNQNEDIRHQIDIYSNISEINNVNICYPNIINSIACGCFAIACKKYLQLNNFDLISIYGLDDYYLLSKLEKLGYLNIVLKDVYITHPKYNNIKYNNWKYSMIEKLLNHTNELYERQMEIFNNMFN